MHPNCHSACSGGVEPPLPNTLLNNNNMNCCSSSNFHYPQQQPQQQQEVAVMEQNHLLYLNRNGSRTDSKRQQGYEDCSSSEGDPDSSMDLTGVILDMEDEDTNNSSCDSFQSNRAVHANHLSRYSEKNNEQETSQSQNFSCAVAKKPVQSPAEEVCDPTESCSSDDSSCCSFFEEDDNDIDGAVPKGDEEAENSATPLIRKIERHVAFRTVEIREYASTVGDHPYCSDTCPVTLDWGYSETMEYDLEYYETRRFLFRRRVPKKLDLEERRDRIMETCDVPEETLREMEQDMAQYRVPSHHSTDTLEVLLDTDRSYLDEEEEDDINDFTETKETNDENPAISADHIIDNNSGEVEVEIENSLASNDEDDDDPNPVKSDSQGIRKIKIPRQDSDDDVTTVTLDGIEVVSWKRLHSNSTVQLQPLQ